MRQALSNDLRERVLREVGTTISSEGQQGFQVGAVLHVNPYQDAGLYSGTYDVMALYD